MTAEACVMNKLGVALAADSAVTLTQRSGTKIYQSADKLFLLSEVDPVAAMIYGSASFMGVPWETILKRYRQLHGKQSRPTVRAHWAALLRSLEGDRQLFPKSMQQEWFRRDLKLVYSEVRDHLEQAFKEALQHEKHLSESRIRQIVNDVVQRDLATLRENAADSRLPKTHSATIQREHAKDIEAAIEEGFENLPMAISARRELAKIAGLVHVSVDFSNQSGLVIAGFGKADIFPAMIRAEVSRVVANRIDVSKYTEKSISDSMHANIAPFAQSEMVHTFMEGIAPDVLKQMCESTGDLVQNRLPQVIADSIPNLSEKARDAWCKQLAEVLGGALGKLFGGWQDYRHQMNVRPILSIVQMLPKDELASLAESLVSLTVLRRRTSTDMETVGGPIDVAVITRGDGFVWIKRKHYFPTELNPRYMAQLGTGAKR